MSESYERARCMLQGLVYSPSATTGGYCNTAAGQQLECLVPLEQQALFRRLQSYTVTTWFGKPPGLQPYDCAVKGWCNTGPDMLTCDTCGSMVWVKLPGNPVSDSAAGIVRRFTKQLTSGHDALCRYSSRGSSPGQQATAATALQFPSIPSRSLVGSFSSRVQDLQRLDIIPTVQPSAVATLGITAVQQLQDNALLKALALLLQVPTAVLQQAAAGQTPLHLSANQSAALLALCGWRVQPLLPEHLTVSIASTSASAFAVSHLVPQQQHRVSGKISSAHAVLACELCGCRVGLWKYSCCGPFHAAQMTSKAAALMASAAAAMEQMGPWTMDHGAPSPAGASGEETENTQTAAKAAAVAPAAPAPGGVMMSIAGGLAEVPGTVAAASEHAKQQQQHQHEADPQQQHPGAAAPGEVRSSLLHTIAGGDLLAAPTTRPCRPAAATSGLGFGLGFGRRRSASLPLSPTQSGPFGSPPAPAFGSAAAAAVRSASVDRQDPHLLCGGEGGNTGGGLFGLGNAAASVFEGFAGHSDVPTVASAQQRVLPAPVFGLGAFNEEVQRIKRHRSSGGAAMGPVGSSSGGGVARVCSASPAHRTPAPAAAVPSPGAVAAPTLQAILDAAAAAVSAGGVNEPTDATGSQGRSTHEPKPLVAAAGKNSSIDADCFDPINQHRPWCPWVHTAGLGRGAAVAGTGSILMGSVSEVKALQLGWSSTLLALLEQMEDEQLQPAAPQTAAVAQASNAPQPGQFDTTAAVLAQARQVLDALE